MEYKNREDIHKAISKEVKYETIGGLADRILKEYDEETILSEFHKDKTKEYIEDKYTGLECLYDSNTNTRNKYSDELRHALLVDFFIDNFESYDKLLIKKGTK